MGSDNFIHMDERQQIGGKIPESNQMITYRFRIRPNKTQERLFHQYAAARCRVWNWGLRRRKEHYVASGKSLTWQTQFNEIVDYKHQPGNEWLLELNAEAVRWPLKELHVAYQKFFADLKRKVRTGPPRFKSTPKSPPTFHFPGGGRIVDDRLVVGKMRIKILSPRPIDGIIKTVRIFQQATGRWYAAIAVDNAAQVPLPVVPTWEKTVGIDIGLISYITLHEGTKIEPPKPLRLAELRLARLQRRLARKVKGSERRKDAKRRLAKLHARIANTRKAWLHKLTTQLVRDYDVICIESHPLKQSKKSRLAKSAMDAAHGIFRQMLEYKTQVASKHLVLIDRWFPSSKLCSHCQHKVDALDLGTREWTCPACGAIHDRDINAAINIRAEGWRQLTISNLQTGAA